MARKVAKDTKFWDFKAKQTDTSNEGELMLYGDISSSSWWGDEVTPKQFKADLDALGDISNLNVYINSGGGDVFAGQAIYTMLKRHSATVNVYIDGLAASIASVIAMAGDIIHMPKNASMMVHNPWTVMMGNSSDFRKMADDLDVITEGLIATYVAKTGMTREEIIPLLDAETWMSADDALKYGFIDEIEEEMKVAASLDSGFFICNNLKVDISNYKNFESIKQKIVVQPKEEPKVIEAPGLNSAYLYKKLLQNTERRMKHV